MGYNLKRSYLLVREEVLRVLAPYDLRPTSFSALVIIVDNPNLSQSGLAKALEIKRSGVVLIADELEKAELISRNNVPGDRRSYALRATEKGQQLCDRVVRQVRDAEANLLSVLSEEETRLLFQLYEKIIGDADRELLNRTPPRGQEYD